MRPTVKLFAVLALPLATLFASAQSIPRADDAKAIGDVRYLLVRRAGSPERNYYELTRTAQIAGRYSEEDISRFKPSPRNYGFDIVTEFTVRYGVYQAWKVRVIGTSDSQKTPTSIKDSAYALIYQRNPDWKFCARKYRVESANNGAKNIIYTDFQDGREYTFEVSPKWPRPWQIYEIEILSSSAFVEIWRGSKQPKADAQ